LNSWALHLLRSAIDLWPVRKLYEIVLMNQVVNGPTPSHIGLILDGNRRWAKEHNLSTIEGHRMGGKKLAEVLSWFRELNVKTVTLYALSTENLLRAPDEVNGILNVIHSYLSKAIEDKVFENEGAKVVFMGERGLLPPRITELMEKLESTTSHNSNTFLNVAIGYGGRTEIVNAVRRMVSLAAEGSLSPEDVTEELVSTFLYTSHLPNPDPDLIVRTSGESRISNFLLWQSAYSELFFLDVYGPEFRKIDLLRAIRSYQRRERRFGR